jgi:mannose-1-phosphate guanylyltransferase
MLHAVIMAGGAGTRFWPESRANSPKQLLALSSDRTMLQMTAGRLAGLVPPERTLVVTNRRLVTASREQLPELPASAVLGEPCKRDTAPCIGLAALVIARTDLDATLAVMPADHVISPTDSFQQALKGAAELVAQKPGRIVTFGIRPTFPAETFGYIERGASLSTPGALKAYQVARFREKPDAATAAEYLASAKFYWNSGIFVWKASTVLAALEEHQPEMYRHLQAIGAAYGKANFDEVFEREFTAIRGVSIDYAVMEHAKEIVVIEAPFAWDDVGSWQSLARLRGTDEHGNTIIGKHLGVNTSGSIVRSSQEHLVVTLGLKDCLVVHTADATLVANKHDEEAIRQVVKLLEERNWQEYL